MAAVTCLDLGSSLLPAALKPRYTLTTSLSQGHSSAMGHYHRYNPGSQLADRKIGKEAARSYTAPALTLENAMGENGLPRTVLGL